MPKKKAEATDDSTPRKSSQPRKRRKKKRKPSPKQALLQKIVSNRKLKARISAREMARRLGLTYYYFLRKIKEQGLTPTEMKKILSHDLPGVTINPRGMCPFMTPEGKILKLANYKMAVRSDNTVVLIEDPGEKEVIEQITSQKTCVICGIHEGEESVSPKTGEGWHLTQKYCLRVGRNRWICYQCCSECEAFEVCPDNHNF